MLTFGKKTLMPDPGQALEGRDEAMSISGVHYVNKHSMVEPFPQGMSKAMFGLGCFWGAERVFWLQPGVYSSAVGYSAGYTKNPTYHEVCSGMTGHNEVVLVIFDPEQCAYESLVKLFYESHNPTQGMRQGNDQGTQYRSGIYYFDEQQKQTALTVTQQYHDKLSANGYSEITTEVIAASDFYYAEEYHQQYLAKNPGGYCGLGGVGVSFNEA